jgi:ATP-dependent DNA ligase
MPCGFIVPCQPSHVSRPPTGRDWIHEIKLGGLRLLAFRAGKRVRLYTPQGDDWGDRFPLISVAVAALQLHSCLIDGEAVICGARGIEGFHHLDSCRLSQAAFLYAFDLLALDGEDLRGEPLEVRKSELARLLGFASGKHQRSANTAPPHPGISFKEHVEADGRKVFEQACRIGLEGIVSKRRGARYNSGPSVDWVSSENPWAEVARRESRL